MKEDQERELVQQLQKIESVDRRSSGCSCSSSSSSTNARSWSSNWSSCNKFPHCGSPAQARKSAAIHRGRPPRGRHRRDHRLRGRHRRDHRLRGRQPRSRRSRGRHPRSHGRWKISGWPKSLVIETLCSLGSLFSRFCVLIQYSQRLLQGHEQSAISDFKSQIVDSVSEAARKYNPIKKNPI